MTLDTACGQSRLILLALALGLLTFLPLRAAIGQIGTTLLLTGKVVDVSGNPIASATVKLQEAAARDVIGKTDGSGVFTLETPRQVRYEIIADTADQQHGELTVVNPRETLRIVVKPTADVQAKMEFTDKSDFTVAGVTDWTAVGGHGSDATLRTSEDMARQTAILKSSDAPPNAMRTGERRSQETELRKAVSAQPESYAANQVLGQFYLDEGRYTDASRLLEKASSLHGGAAADEYEAALACRGEGDFARARQHVQRALTQSDRANYHRLAGELDEKLGEPLSSVQEEERAAMLEPSEENYFAWGSELLLHRAIWQAAEVFSKGAELHPKSQRLKTGWGAALFAGAKYEEAAKRLCEASDLDLANRETYIFLGKLGLGSPETETCVREKLARFVRLYPGDTDANYYEAMLLLKEDVPGNQGQAAVLLQKAVALNPRFAEGYLQLGVLALAQNDTVSAQADFEHAIAADPTQAESHYRLGVVYERAGHPEQAKAEFARHEVLVKEQADAVERERRQVKQFLVVLGGGAPGRATP